MSAQRPPRWSLLVSHRQINCYWSPNDSDQIRPDWEHKLNAVKAAAARKASRRIVMRQVRCFLPPPVLS